MSAGNGIGVGHVIGAVGVVSLCISAYLFGTLQASRDDLGAEVEQSVKNGIQGGLDEALAPDVIEDRSAAVGRGMVDGVIDGALQKATDEETRRFGKDAAKVVLKEADAVAGEGLKILGAALAPPQVPGDQAAPDDLTPDSAPPPPTLAEDVGAVAQEAAGLGFDVLDAVLGEPREQTEGGDTAQAGSTTQDERTERVPSDAR